MPYEFEIEIPVKFIVPKAEQQRLQRQVQSQFKRAGTGSGGGLGAKERREAASFGKDVMAEMTGGMAAGTVIARKAATPGGGTGLVTGAAVGAQVGGLGKVMKTGLGKIALALGVILGIMKLVGTILGNEFSGIKELINMFGILFQLYLKPFSNLLFALLLPVFRFFLKLLPSWYAFLDDPLKGLEQMLKAVAETIKNAIVGGAAGAGDWLKNQITKIGAGLAGIFGPGGTLNNILDGIGDISVAAFEDVSGYLSGLFGPGGTLNNILDGIDDWFQSLIPDFSWPPIPTFSWPPIPKFSWPKLLSFKWSSFIPAIKGSKDFWKQFVPSLDWDDFLKKSSSTGGIIESGLSGFGLGKIKEEKDLIITKTGVYRPHPDDTIIATRGGFGGVTINNYFYGFNTQQAITELEQLFERERREYR